MDIKKTSQSSTLREIEHILIVGLGKSGLSCVNYLTKQIEFKKKLFEISVYDINKIVKEQLDWILTLSLLSRLLRSFVS